MCLSNPSFTQRLNSFSIQHNSQAQTKGIVFSLDGKCLSLVGDRDPLLQREPRKVRGLFSSVPDCETP